MKKVFILLFLALSLSIRAQDMFQDSKSSSSNDIQNSIGVTLGGSFIVNGSFPASPFERADQLITRIFSKYKAEGIGKLDKEEDINIMNQKLENFARRNILLKRASGDVIIDLEKFRLTGDFKYNPYLKSDDVLIFPALDMDRNFFIIDGAVNNPVKMQFVDGDRLSDAVLLAQGINKAYENVTQAEITRLSYDGTKEEIVTVNVNDDVLLLRGDRIRVLAEETNKKDFKVLVLGEVNRPGFISITKNSTNVKEVLKKAGGVKTSADLNLTELIKVSDPYKYYKQRLFTKNYNQNILLDDKYDAALFNLFDNKKVENMLMQRTANISLEDSLLFLFDNNLRLWKQQSAVDFTKLEDDSSSDGKYLVEDGDMIIVPRKSNSVYVFGQVAQTGYQPFIKGKDARYYINQAGGLGMNAKDIDETMLIKGKSRNWINIDNEEAQIEPGDFVWVPKKERKDFIYYMSRISPVASILGTAATIVFLLIQINK